MKRFIESYGGEELDVVVIGGGITGAAVAYDAASRGLSVALLEKHDFGCATSAATSKLIHGGFRYLARGELGIVRESLRERRILTDVAPNLVYPIPVLIPRYDRGPTRHVLVMKSAMLLYDLLSFDKGRARDPGKRIGPHRALPAAEALELEPIVPRDGLRGAYLYHDCASLFPERLTLAFVKSAVRHGAAVANHARVEGLVLSPGGEKKVIGITARDMIRGGVVEVRGRQIVNCAGPWVDSVLGGLPGGSAARKIRRSEGIHVVIGKGVHRHMIVMVTSGGRGFFLIPWRGRTLIGTTDREFAGEPDEFRVTRGAILGLLATVNATMRTEPPIEYGDVLYAYGGLRPLVADGSADVSRSSRRYEIHDHEKDGIRGLITAEGGKYTTSRSLAKKVVDGILRKRTGSRGTCVTAQRHLAGCEIDDLDGFLGRLKADHEDFPGETVERLGRYYGSECRQVLDLARADPSLARPLNEDGEIAAQAVHAVRKEMALTLGDIVLRRTGIATAGSPGQETLVWLADLAGRELAWDAARREREIRDVEDRLRLPD